MFPLPSSYLAMGSRSTGELMSPTHQISSLELTLRFNHCTMCTLYSIFFRPTEQAQTYLKIYTSFVAFLAVCA